MPIFVERAAKQRRIKIRCECQAHKKAKKKKAKKKVPVIKEADSIDIQQTLLQALDLCSTLTELDETLDEILKSYYKQSCPSVKHSSIIKTTNEEEMEAQKVDDDDDNMEDFGLLELMNETIESINNLEESIRYGTSINESCWTIKSLRSHEEIINIPMELPEDIPKPEEEEEKERNANPTNFGRYFFMQRSGRRFGSVNLRRH